LQPELFNRALTITPAPGRSEPRLWVRRLIIWRAPGDEVRNVELRPGLNVIWSPDDHAQEGAPGHGGGKTTFCRLLRYCLGEETLGPSIQRQAIADKMPEGAVGAEVRLDGETWLIRRSFVRQDYALKGSSFADLSEFPAEATGMKPFLGAVTGAFLNSALPLMPSSIGENGAWQALLAWLTRDQECRFAHLLDWRSPDSGSRSPVSGRGRPQDDREAIVRIVLCGLRLEEIQTRQRLEAENSGLTKLQTELSRLGWQLDQTRTGLATALGLAQDGASKLDAEILKSAASDQLTKVRGEPSAVTLDALRAAGDAVSKAVRQQGEADAAIKLSNSRIGGQDQLAKMIADQLPELSAQNQRLQRPVCPVCEVPIDQARAEGCGISLQSCDVDALQARVDERKRARGTALAEVARLKSELPSLRQIHALATQTLEQAQRRLSAIEKSMFERTQELRRAERNSEEAERFARIEADLERTRVAIEQKEGAIAQLKTELEQHRGAVAQVIGELSDRFNAVFRELIPGEARCDVALDGNGLRIKLPVNGAAIDSLKIAVFDLAVLSMAIEDKTLHPGFLVHDSPREADLGGSIYAGLFNLAEKLGRFGSEPLFQYVVTTTTKPPGHFSEAPWQRLQLRGAPADERLLKADL
jgi:hypothetical protein